LIEVLERDGGDILKQRKNLAQERSDLATQTARQFQLLGQGAHWADELSLRL